MLKKLVLGLIDGAGLGVARMILLPVAAVCKASVQWKTTLHMHGVNVSVYLKRKSKRTNNDLQTHRTSKTLIVICINCIRYILSNTCHRFRHLTQLNGAYKKKHTREVSVVRGSGTFCTHKGGFILRVRQRCDGIAMSLSTSLSHRSDNTSYRWPSLANIFFARIIACCRSRVEIILTFKRRRLIAIWNH